jgi:LAO/AO transport system kinase
MLAGAGDELQGIKKGIMEMADTLVITKADGDNKTKCERAQREYKNALHLFPPSESGWYPDVLLCSAVTNEGLEGIWQETTKYISAMKNKGFFLKNRQNQNIGWMHDIIEYSLKQRFYTSNHIIPLISALEQEIQLKQTPAISAARKLLSLYHNS